MLLWRTNDVSRCIIPVFFCTYDIDVDIFGIDFGFGFAAASSVSLYIYMGVSVDSVASCDRAAIL